MRKASIAFIAVYLLVRTSTGQLVGIVESKKVPTADGATAYEVSGGTKAAVFGEVLAQVMAAGPDKVAVKGGRVIVRRERETVVVTKAEVEEPAGLDLK